MNTNNVSNSLQIKGLRRKFILSLAILDRGYTDLRTAIVGLMAAGVETGEMVEWAVEEGYSESWARNLIGQVLIRNGQRRRDKGAGPKTPPVAMEFAAAALEMFGSEKEAAKFLLAAYRALKGHKLKSKRHPHIKIKKYENSNHRPVLNGV